MQRTHVAALAIVACLLAMGSMVGAEAPSADEACEQACLEQESACMTDCAHHDNPIECEANCREAKFDCLRSCS